MAGIECLLGPDSRGNF
jgi:hypothetical protein